MLKSHLTNCGIPGIGMVPYGAHICHFYMSGQDLLDCLIPYFLAGLSNNESCLWIASPPLPSTEIWTEIAKFSEMKAAVKSGQMRIFDACEWYGELSALKAEDIIQRWIAKEKRAIAEGFQGLRIAGNTSFFPRAYWTRLMEYEELFHTRLQDRRIVTCCSYYRYGCLPVDVLEVLHRHDAALDRDNDHWQIFTQDRPHNCRQKSKIQLQPETEECDHQSSF